jgi:hypothetical protein
MNRITVKEEKSGSRFHYPELITLEVKSLREHEAFRKLNKLYESTACFEEQSFEARVIKLKAFLN